MSETTVNKIDFGSCLHDGIIENLRSDLMSRTLRFVINSPFHWEFHKLAEATRFEIVCERVCVVAAFKTDVWPGSTEPSRDVPWDQAQQQRKDNITKSRLVSASWVEFTEQIREENDHVIVSADLLQQPTDSQLKMGILCPDGDYRNIEIRAEQFRLFIAGTELTPQEFEEFGNAYWKDWSLRTKLNV